MLNQSENKLTIIYIRYTKIGMRIAALITFFARTYFDPLSV